MLPPKFSIQRNNEIANINAKKAFGKEVIGDGVRNLKQQKFVKVCGLVGFVTQCFITTGQQNPAVHRWLPQIR